VFERYTEAARRALFFARYEASQLGGVSIETEHLLLGLMREGAAFTRLAPISVETVRAELESRAAGRRVSTAVEMPFSAETRRVLQFAVEEADGLRHAHIGSEHLLLGLLREERSGAATTLAALGVRVSDVRDRVAKLPVPLAGSPEALAAQQADEIKRLLEELGPAVRGNAQAFALLSRLHAALEDLRRTLGGQRGGTLD
jgi:ATP-dependent Clp protease ATP-binding subunit ClpC